MRVFVRNFENEGESNNASDHATPGDKEKFLEFYGSTLEAKSEEVVNRKN